MRLWRCTLARTQTSFCFFGQRPLTILYSGLIVVSSRSYVSSCVPLRLLCLQVTSHNSFTLPYETQSKIHPLRLTSEVGVVCLKDFRDETRFMIHIFLFYIKDGIILVYRNSNSCGRCRRGSYNNSSSSGSSDSNSRRSFTTMN